jgi:hypothetical protein
MANLIFNGFKQYQADGTINLESDTLKVALFDKNFVPDRDTMDNWGDISASELSGANYVTGGNELTGKTFSHDDANDKGIMDANDVTYTNVTLVDVRWAVVYKVAVGTAAKLIGAWDFGANQNPVTVDLVVKWNAGGLLTWSQGT